MRKNKAEMASGLLMVDPEDKKEKEKVEAALTSRRFTRQRKGFRAVRQRKRNEKRAMNKLLHAPRKAKRSMKKAGISDKIQHGFDIAKGWE